MVPELGEGERGPNYSESQSLAGSERYREEIYFN